MRVYGGMYIILYLSACTHGPSHTESPPVLLLAPPASPSAFFPAGRTRDAHSPVSIIPGVLFVCTCKCTGIVFADAADAP